MKSELGAAAEAELQQDREYKHESEQSALRTDASAQFPTPRNSTVLIYLRPFSFYRGPRSSQIHRSTCPVYDVPFKYFISLNTYTRARAEPRSSFSFLRKSGAHPREHCVTLPALGVSAFLFTFLLISRHKLRPLIQPRYRQ